MSLWAHDRILQDMAKKPTPSFWSDVPGGVVLCQYCYQRGYRKVGQNYPKRSKPSTARKSNGGETLFAVKNTHTSTTAHSKAACIIEHGSEGKRARVTGGAPSSAASSDPNGSIHSSTRLQKARKKGESPSSAVSVAIIPTDAPT